MRIVVLDSTENVHGMIFVKDHPDKCLLKTSGPAFLGILPGADAAIVHTGDDPYCSVLQGMQQASLSGDFAGRVVFFSGATSLRVPQQRAAQLVGCAEVSALDVSALHTRLLKALKGDDVEQLFKPDPLDLVLAFMTAFLPLYWQWLPGQPCPFTDLDLEMADTTYGSTAAELSNLIYDDTAHHPDITYANLWTMIQAPIAELDITKAQPAFENALNEAKVVLLNWARSERSRDA